MTSGQANSIAASLRHIFEIYLQNHLKLGMWMQTNKLQNIVYDLCRYGHHINKIVSRHLNVQNKMICFLFLAKHFCVATGLAHFY